MSEASDFCTRCGTPVAPGNASCTSCGTAIPASTPSSVPPPAPGAVAQPQPPSTDEQVLSILGGVTQSSGFMGMKKTAYTLIMTNRRLVFAQLTPAMLKVAVDSAQTDAKSEGGGFFKQWGAQISASFQYAEKYWQIAPDAALAETAGNFIIDRGAILKMKLHAGMTHDESADDPDYITIKTSGGKYKLELSGGRSHAEKALVSAGLI